MSGACKGCTERHIGCHSNCERYAADVEERAKRNALINAAKAREYMIDGVLINQSLRKRDNIMSIEKRRRGY